MKLIIQIAVCAGLSIVFQKLLLAYWTQKEGPHHNHESDAWVFGVIAGVVIGLLVVEGLDLPG
jgi:hypothetical protein